MTPKGIRGYGEGGPSRVFQLFFGWIGKGHINCNRTTSIFQPEVLYFLLLHDCALTDTHTESSGEELIIASACCFHYELTLKTECLPVGGWFKSTMARVIFKASLVICIG